MKLENIKNVNFFQEYYMDAYIAGNWNNLHYNIVVMILVLNCCILDIKKTHIDLQYFKCTT